MRERCYCGDCPECGQEPRDCENCDEMAIAIDDANAEREQALQEAAEVEERNEVLTAALRALMDAEGDDPVREDITIDEHTKRTAAWVQVVDALALVDGDGGAG